MTPTTAPMPMTNPAVRAALSRRVATPLNWAVTDPAARQMDAVMFKKNMALLGAAWMLLLIPQPWPLSL